MHLIIDGYNLIHHSPELFWAGDMERGREALLTALRLYRQKRSHQITVVFDGGQDLQPRRASQLGVPVIYSGAKQKADQVIVELAGRLGAGATVITDDRELAGLCRVRGAEVIGSRIFASRLMATAQGQAQAAEDDEPGWDFSTRKKGPSHREPKAKRRHHSRLERL